MDISIYPIPLGFDHCYVIEGQGMIMIDSGVPKKANSFLKATARVSIQPEDVQLIVITHGHFDHIGSAKDIKEITGAKIVMHQKDKGCLEKSVILLPPGVTVWGRILIRMMTMLMPLVNVPKTEVDVVLKDGELSLDEFGIPGKVIHTPGHTAGSISVLLETGEAFVGDLAMNKLPLRMSPGLPILAEDLQRVKESWKMLLDQGAERIYPGHGKPFSAEYIRKALM